MDDRGHGKTSVPADPRKLINWNIFRDDLAAFVRSLGGPVIALGHSRGGRPACGWPPNTRNWCTRSF